MKESLEGMRQSAWQDLFGFVHTNNDQHIVELLADKIFHDLMHELDDEGRPVISTMEDFAYVFVAPLVLAFLKWFFEVLQREKYDKILFSTRDGYFIQKLYHQMTEKYGIKNMPQYEYFPISRTLCVAANVFSEEDIINFAKVKYAKEPEAMLNRRFGLNKKDILPYDKGIYKNVVEYALAHSDKIFDSSKQIRDNYVHYMKGIGLESGKKYALFDFVSSGTCQQLLSHIIELDIEGIYMCRYYPFQGITNYTDPDEKRRLPVKAYITIDGDDTEKPYFFKNYNFLEIIFTSPEPSIASMSTEGPILDKEERSAKDLEITCIAQNAIKQYMDDIGPLISWDEGITFPLVDRILSLKETAFTRLECEYLNNLELIEDFGQGRIKVR